METLSLAASIVVAYLRRLWRDTYSVLRTKIICIKYKAVYRLCYLVEGGHRPVKEKNKRRGALNVQNQFLISLVLDFFRFLPTLWLNLTGCSALAWQFHSVMKVFMFLFTMNFYHLITNITFKMTCVAAVAIAAASH